MDAHAPERAATLVDLLDANLRDRPDALAVVVVPEAGEPRSLTVAALHDRSLALAARLVADHAPGDRALLLHTTTLSFVVGLVACLRAGLVPVPSPLPGGQAHQRARVQGIAADCDAALVLVDAAAASDVVAWADGVRRADGSPLAVLALDDATPDAAGSPAPAGRLPRPAPEDVAFLQYTSGSTSDPKGVVVTHANVVHHHRAFVEGLALTPEDRFCSWLPAYHDFGLVGMLLVPLGLGATTYLMSPSYFLKRPARWLTLVDEAGITVTASPNFGYEHCVRRVRDAQVEGLDLSRLRWALNGAEPVDAATLDGFTRRFAPAGFRAASHGPGYGLAEATLTVSYPTGGDPLVVHADTAELGAGRLVPVPHDRADGRTGATRLVGCGVPRGVQVRLVDEDGAAVPDGRVGEVWLRGGGVAAGYWGAAAATAETFGAVAADGSGPWLRTGDLGALHDGQLVVTGRIKELLLVAGRNLYPYDLERELRDLHAGAQGRPGAVFESAPGSLCAVQEFRPSPVVTDGTDPLDDVVRAMAAYLAEVSGAAVHDVVLVRPGQVPRTTSGKVQRGRARDLLRAGDLDEIHSLRASRRSRVPSEPAGTPA